MLKELFTLTCMCFVGFSVQSTENRNILQKEATEVDLAKALAQSFSELNYPDYTDRDFWSALPESIVHEYISSAEQYLEYDWPALKATDFLEIIRSGDRMSDAFKAPLRVLNTCIMGELAEDRGRFMDQIVNGVWYFSEQTWWGRSAHLTMQSAPHGLPDVDDPVIDLGVADVAYTLSWAWYLFKEDFDAIHPLIAKRLRDEVMTKALIPFYEREDMWWMGFDGTREKLNNWTPHILYSMLTAIMILEQDRSRKLFGIEKALRSLDIFLNGYPEDGGCDEGPSYWGKSGGGLYENLDLLKRATNGAFNVYDHPLIANIGRFIYRAYIDYPYFVNFSDADAMMSSRPFIIYCYGRDIGDTVMQNFGAFLAQQQGWGAGIPGGKIGEQLQKLAYLEEIDNARAENALVGTFWLPQTEICGARDAEGTSAGFFFAAKGSHNGESHNHNDVGTCVLYYNGQPCLIDLGRQTYTAKTFGERRYEIWTMQSQYHNVPVINGMGQGAGLAYRAEDAHFHDDDQSVLFSVDIARAYPADAQVEKWTRSYRLHRQVDFRIRDAFELKERTAAATRLHFMTSCTVSQPGADCLILTGSGFMVQMQYNARKVRPVVEYIEVTDPNLREDWAAGVTRIAFDWIGKGTAGKHEIVITAMD